MESFDPHVLGTLAVLSGLGVAMVWLGARFRLLQQRQATRCPSCGLLVRRNGSCGCSS
jgi:hypothetical protein